MEHSSNLRRHLCPILLRMILPLKIVMFLAVARTPLCLLGATDADFKLLLAHHALVLA